MKPPIRACAILALALVGGARAGESGEPTLDQLLDLPADGEAEGKDGPSVPDAAVPQPKRADGPKGAFRAAVREMEAAADRLAGPDGAGAETQRLQKRIVARLERALSAANRRPSGGGGGSGSARTQPRKRDRGAGPAGGKGAGSAGAARAGGSAGAGARSGGAPRSADGAGRDAEQRNAAHGDASWGQLPPRVREQLMQGMGESYSAVYRRLTERYYRRLAEEASEP